MTNFSNVRPSGFVLAAALLLASCGKAGDEAQPVQDEVATRKAALASQNAPSYGDPNAKVHIVEFLDPACETCAVFYPMVK
ncbi:MAG: thioredoxin domain-containing protein, partial [Woeseiaceae bacterium]